MIMLNNVQIIIVPWVITFVTICAVLPLSTTTGDDRVDVAMSLQPPQTSGLSCQPSVIAATQNKRRNTGKL